MCRRPAVRVLGVLALGLMVLGAGSGLYAVPVVRLTGGGGHTTDITGSDCTTFAPGVCIVLFNPVDLVALDANGLGSLGIDNGLTQTITALDFVLPTSNFNQGFSASTIATDLGQTTIFTTAQLIFVPSVFPIGVTGGTGGSLVPAFPTIEPAINVVFSGTGTGSGSTTGPTNPCGTGPFAAFFNCPANGPSGFDAGSLKPDKSFPNGEGYLVVTYGAPAANCTLCGLAPGAEATFSAAVPEPGLFPLSLIAVGVLVMVRQKIYRR
jgi:hypothetical protein